MLDEAELDLTDEICEDLNPARQVRATEASTTSRYVADVLGCAAWRLE